MEKTQQKIQLSSAPNIHGFNGRALTLIQKQIADFGICQKDFTITAIKDETVPADGYVISLNEDNISVRFSNTRGMIYSAVTLRQLSEFDELYAGELSDSPDCEFRGYRAYLPGRKSFQEFYDIVDFLVDYKYNYISLEVGGAMEYKHHPEINQKWAEFAAETHRYSDRASEIQNGYPWAKNSIHTDNAEGDILSQDEVRHLFIFAFIRILKK